MSWWRNWLLSPGLGSEVEGICAGRQILRQISPDGLSRFDAALHGRSWTAPRWFPSLWEVKPHHVRRLAELSSDVEATALILAAHPSGWVRQAALPLLEECCTPLALGMLVLRSNDWVEAIRIDAQARLKKVAAGQNIQPLISVIPAVEQLARSASRSGDFAREFLRYLTDRLTRTALMGGLRDPSLRVRRSSARLLVSKGLPDDALDVALNQEDTITAYIVALAAARMDTSRAMSERLVAARSPRLRRLGLVRLIEHADDAATEAARQALLDSHAHVRSEAQSYLRRSGVAVSPIYATLLESRPAVAIVGLAETGTKDDAGRVVLYASHASARVRDAVCLALAKLAPHDYRRTLLQLAHDQSGRVARHAAGAIVRSNADPAELDQLWSFVVTQPGRRAVLSAFESLDRWVQLTYAFRAISSDIARNEGMLLLEHVMTRWNASFTTPSAERARALALLLPTVIGRLESKAAHELDLTVSTHLRRHGR
jgi:hypothetical protein